MGGSSKMNMPRAQIRSPDGGASHPIGTGPFTFESWQPNSDFRATRNPTYWGGLSVDGHRRSGLPYPDSIEFRVIPDDATRASAVQDGDINMMLTTDAGAANSMQSSYTVVRDWSTSEDAFVLPNTAAVVDGKPNPLHDIHARRALALATDSHTVTALIGAGVQAPTSPWSPDNPWGMPDADNGYAHGDLAQAKAEVAKYEQDTGQSPLEITLLGQPSTNEQRILQLLQSQWKRAGIVTHIQTLAATAYLTKVVFGDFEAAFSHNYGFPDPDSNYPFWSSTTANGPGKVSINVSQYASTQIDDDLRTGRESGFPKVRKAAYDDLVRQLNGAVTNIWLYHTPYSLIAQRSVQGLDDPSGPAHIAFGNYQPKTWWGTVWIQS
jgi:peptide/nickel transport system substrate-binding protein